ncbi:MAG: AMP phosphorylase [Candidatus Diapherotrites archaeon]|nr:AMP phosphorylase [Candidatus Diapherotrites archaeon]
MEAYSLELKAKPFAINAGRHIAILHAETAARLGLHPLDRIEIQNREKKIRTATVIDTTDTVLKKDEIGLFSELAELLEAEDSHRLEVSAAGIPDSLNSIKKKLNGATITSEEIKSIVRDINSNKLSDIELSAFMTAVHIRGFDLNETVAMAQALSENGRKIKFDVSPIVDKHSIGGINGRATMLVVPIVAAAGLYIPKTSSRSITSAAGTADSMEVLANVNLSAAKVKEITEKEGGIIMWGGSLDLAPVDDKIIRVEYPLSQNPQGQVIASVIAKKAAVGSKFVVIDIPIGQGMKISDRQQGSAMAEKFIAVGRRMGMRVEAVLTDGSQPSGNAFGPALEAKNVMQILEGEYFDNLAQKSCELCGVLFELAGKTEAGQGFDYAKKILKSGKALTKMQQIIKAQGKRVNSSKKIEMAPYSAEIRAESEGEVARANVKKLIELAKIAGAPYDKKAGVLLNVEQGHAVEKGGVLYTIYSENKRKLALAEKLALASKPVEFEKIILEKIS